MSPEQAAVLITALTVIQTLLLAYWRKQDSADERGNDQDGGSSGGDS